MESNNKKETRINAKNTEIKKGLILFHIFNVFLLIFCDGGFPGSSKTAKVSQVKRLFNALLSRLKEIVEKIK